MAKGNYIVSSNKEKTELSIRLAPGAAEEIPADQRQLLEDVVSVFMQIRPLYNSDIQSYNKYFDSIVNAAQTGLVGDHADTILAGIGVPKEVNSRISNQPEFGLEELAQPEVFLPRIIIGPPPGRCPCCGTILAKQNP